MLSARGLGGAAKFVVLSSLWNLSLRDGGRNVASGRGLGVVSISDSERDVSREEPSPRRCPAGFVSHASFALEYGRRSTPQRSQRKAGENQS